jgi:hypothetical protein
VGFVTIWTSKVGVCLVGFGELREIDNGLSILTTVG